MYGCSLYQVHYYSAVPALLLTAILHSTGVDRNGELDLLGLSYPLISDVCSGWSVCKDRFLNLFTQGRAHSYLIECYIVDLKSVLLITPTVTYHWHIHSLHRWYQLLLLTISDCNLKKMSVYSDACTLLLPLYDAGFLPLVHWSNLICQSL
jgi:hypothetical protein